MWADVTSSWSAVWQSSLITWSRISPAPAPSWPEPRGRINTSHPHLEGDSSHVDGPEPGLRDEPPLVSIVWRIAVQHKIREFGVTEPFAGCVYDHTASGLSDQLSFLWKISKMWIRGGGTPLNTVTPPPPSQHQFIETRGGGRHLRTCRAASEFTTPTVFVFSENWAKRRRIRLSRREITIFWFVPGKARSVRRHGARAVQILNSCRYCEDV